MSMCCFRSPARPNELPHCVHLCTFSPVWVIMCVLNFPASPKDFSHSVQVWDFTPLWVSMCLFRFAAWPNAFWHWTHVYALSLLWNTLMCLFRDPVVLNDFSHIEQIFIFLLSLFGIHVAFILINFDVWTLTLTVLILIWLILILLVNTCHFYFFTAFSELSNIFLWQIQTFSPPVQTDEIFKSLDTFSFPWNWRSERMT